MSERFLIWSNEHKMWWRPASMGYTTKVEAAGRYSLTEAVKICNNANQYQWVEGRMNPNEMPIAEDVALMLDKPREAA